MAGTMVYRTINGHTITCPGSATPTAADLPATINCLQFIWQNFLKNNLKVLYIKQDCMQGPLEMQGLYSLLNNLIPPEQAVIQWQKAPETSDTFLTSLISEESSCFEISATGSDTLPRTDIFEEITLSEMG